MFGNYKYNLVCNVSVLVIYLIASNLNPIEITIVNDALVLPIYLLFQIFDTCNKTKSENIKMIWSNAKSGNIFENYKNKLNWPANTRYFCEINV
jgi:hypothetical protein